MTAPTTLPRRRLRLIADDLTGALDTAAEFVPAHGPVRVVWGRPRPAAGAAVAFDIATREGSADEAAAAAARVIDLIDFADADVAYLKVDSLLRGHAGAELAACLASGAFTHAIIAPAFPFQNRHTRNGRQWAPLGGTWQATGEDIAATLAARGVALTRSGPGGYPAPGVTLYDAETEADLAAIVASGRELAGARILWCGSGGLAGALGAVDVPREAPALPLRAPVLGLFGTDHPVTETQLQRAGDLAIRLPDGGDASATRLTARLAGDGAALAAFDLPRLERGEAARRIAAEMTRLVARLAPPALLVCGGGETLRAICEALGAEALDVVGRVVPGVPRAVLVGGRWDGVDVVSKSGAFGDPDFLARLVAPVARIDAHVFANTARKG